MIAFIIYSARQRNYMPELGQVGGERAGLRMAEPTSNPIENRGQEHNPYLSGLDRFGQVH